jgi:hypothetical protein
MALIHYILAIIAASNDEASSSCYLDSSIATAARLLPDRLCRSGQHKSFVVTNCAAAS